MLLIASELSTSMPLNPITQNQELFKAGGKEGMVRDYLSPLENLGRKMADHPHLF